jgi:hypothetical protein
MLMTRRTLHGSMIAVTLVAATLAAGDVTPLDPNSTEPLVQQISRSATRSSSLTSAAAAAMAARNAPSPAAVATTVDAQFAAIDKEVARLRALGEPARARADMLARRVAEVRALQDANGVASDAQPELHVVGVYGNDARINNAGPATLPAAQRRRLWKTGRASVVVEVQSIGRPIVLAVCAYSRVTWELHIAKDANVQRVIVGGYEQQDISGVPDGIPVEKHTCVGDVRSPNFFYTYGAGTEAHAQAVARLRALTSLEIATVTGAQQYPGTPFVVGPANQDWVVKRVLSRLEPLYRESIAYARSTERGAVPDVRFQAIKFPAPDIVPVPMPAGAAGFPGQPRVVVRAGAAGGSPPALADFTPAGAVEGTERKLPPRTTLVATDPADSTIYAIDQQGVMRIDPQTQQVTRLTVDDPNLPRMSMPSGIAFDTKRRRLLVSTNNGTGFLYAYDPTAGKWSGLVDLEGAGVTSLVYSPEHDCLYAATRQLNGRSGRLMLLRYTPEGDADQAIEILDPSLAAITFSFDSNPQLVAVGEQLAYLPTVSRMEIIRMRAGAEGALPTRPKCYLIDPRTARVTYVGILQPQAAVAQKLTEAEIEEAWRALAAEDATDAEHAMSRLAGARDDTVMFLRGQLQPITATDPQRVRGWIADLGHDEFTRRDAATSELRRLGAEAEPALREALKTKPSPEAATRIETLLAELAPDGQATRKPDREALAVQLLARIGTPTAIDYLGELAAGIPGAPRTNDARRALQEFARDD